uniref:C2H2-type domain-containing protein n=1 Tax=Oryza punctata TaxID=4537 RepID=A0A0E0KB14_ORYPU
MALVKSHHQMLASSSTSSSSPSSHQQPPPPPASNSSSLAAAADQPSPAKRKRRPPGTPDPDAEVVALSPRTLLESDRYVCEICGQGFQREQNLQMHRRRHKVPWRLVKRPAAAAAAGGGGGEDGGAAGGAGEAARKRVFVCPEPSCLHHDPAHALGDLVGIKKHFRRKHGGRRQWVCARCAKGYAVQSDYKAHLKTCGTRGHSCDCGRVFSRVESFIEHQDACNSGRVRGEVVPVATTLPVIRPAALRHHHPPPALPPPELQLLPASTTAPLAAAFSSNSTTTTTTGSSSHEQHATTMTTKLQLSIGPAVVVAASDGGGATAAAGEEEQREEVTCHACRQRSLAVMSMAAVDGHGASAVAREHLRGGGVGAGI